MNIRGQGDRWLAGEPIQGVQLEHRAAVEIIGGPHAGQTGSVAFLMSLDADPLYLVELGSGAGDAECLK